LKEMGVNAELEFLEWTALFDKFNNGDFDLLCYGYGTFIDPDEFYYSRLHRSVINNGWDNPEYNNLVEEARRAVDFTTRQQKYARAQELIMEELPLLVTFSEVYAYVHNERVQGFKPWGAVFTRFWNVWVTE
jgi:peptide/nickel transport system substrate-binding protein